MLHSSQMLVFVLGDFNNTPQACLQETPFLNQREIMPHDNVLKRNDAKRWVPTVDLAHLLRRRHVQFLRVYISRISNKRTTLLR